MREDAYERYVQRAKLSAAKFQATESSDSGPAFWTGRSLYRSVTNPWGATSAAEGSGDGDNNHSNDGTSSSLDEMATLLGYSDDMHQSRTTKSEGGDEGGKESRQYPKLWELAKAEGDKEWIDWLGSHIWTYVGLAAPLLGAPGPLRSVLSGENMGLPFTHEMARGLELSFGSTTTVHPISSKMGFCDRDDVPHDERGANLACLEEILGIIESSKGDSPWKNFPALRLLLKDRVDFDSAFPMVSVEREYCHEGEASPCNNQTSFHFGAEDVMTGNLFSEFSSIWTEKGDPMRVQQEQLQHAWWRPYSNIPNMLKATPDR